MGLGHTDLIRMTPALLTGAPIVTLSTDSAPALDPDGGPLEAGQTWLKEDTGQLFYYTAAGEWKLATFAQTHGLQTALLMEIRDLLQGDE